MKTPGKRLVGITGCIASVFLFLAMNVCFATATPPKEGVFPGINAPLPKSPPKFDYKGEIVIGDASDLTGPAAKSCSEMSAGLADWFRYQNDYLGGVRGYKIAAKIVDTKFDSQSTINTFNRFIDEGKPIIYSGHGYCIPATTEIANRRHVPTLGSSGSVEQSIFPPEKEKEKNYFFQMSPVVASRMAILVNFFMDDWKKKGKTGKPKFGGFCCDSHNGHEAATAIKIYAEKLGGEFTINTFHAKSITDAKAQVTALKRAKVDYILNGPDYDQPLTVFALELARQKSKKWNPIFGGHTCWGTAYIETGNKAFENHYSYQYCLSWDDVDEPVIALLHKLNKMWHPKVKKRPFLYQAGFQAGMVICEAFRKAIDKWGDPKNIDGEKMRDALESLQEFDPLGISGPISYSNWDHQGVKSLRIAVCKDGKLEAVGGFVPAQTLEPKERYGKYWLTE